MELNEDPEAPHGREDDGTPKAPYGLKADGTPRKLPGRPVSAPAPKAKKPEPKRPASKGVDYTEGIKGLCQIPIVALSLAGMKNATLAADAYVLAANVQPFAEALNEVAHHQPMVATVLDKALQVGPLGAVFAVLIPPALQIMANHGVVPAGFGGTMSRDAILVAMEAEAAQQYGDMAAAA